MLYWALLEEVQNWRHFRSHYRSGRKFAEDSDHLYVGGQAVVDREDLAETQVDLTHLRWGKRPEEKKQLNVV
jgi:hypothetical protein